MKVLAGLLVGAGLVVGAAHAAAPPSLRASAEPASIGVGDTWSYVVEARLEAKGLDASSVRIFADTGPFAQVRATRTMRSNEGSVVVVRLEQQLACLDLACVPDKGLRRIRLPAAQVTARLPGGAVRTSRARPVAVAVEPRVASTAVRAASPPYRQQTVLPAPSGHAGRLVALLAIATAALGLLAVLLALLALRRRASAGRREAELARALRLLRESAARPAPDRRRAADLVSRVVGAAGAESLSDDAAHLAWSARSPEPAGAEALAERVDGTVR